MLSNFFVRKIHSRFSFVLASWYMCFCFVGIFCVFFVLVPVLFLSLLRVLWVSWIAYVSSRNCRELPGPLLF